MRGLRPTAEGGPDPRTGIRADRVRLGLTYAVALLGVGPSLLHLSPLFSVVLVAGCAAGAFWDYRDYHPVSPWAVNTLAILGLLLAMALPSPGGSLGRMLSAATVLLAAKLVSPKETRDHLQIILLSLLLLVGSAILSVDLGFAVLFLAYLVLSTIALSWLPFSTELGRNRVPRALIRRVTKVSLGMIAASIPLIALLFVALPRTAMPLWEGLGPAGAATAGFSDRVRLGDVSRIAGNSEVAFRAEIRGDEGPLAATPYWRGLVFEATDGVSWTRIPWDDPRVNLPPPGDGAVRQIVYLEPHGERYLFSLDRPLRVERGHERGASGHAQLLESRHDVDRRISYEVLSDPDPWLRIPASSEDLRSSLEVPPGLPPEIADLAERVTRGADGPLERAELLVEHLRGGDYDYSREIPDGSGHPLAQFLFETRTGYCEYYASALALMLRTQGVPARMVGGYVGGTYNSNGNYYIVRQDSAHTWVEAYIAGEGWLRLDPTPPSTEQGGGGDALGSGDGSSTFMLLDSLRLRWYASVIGYDLETQGSLLRQIVGLFDPREWSLGALGTLFALLGAVSLAVLLIVLRRRTPDPLEDAYDSLLGRLRKRGLVRAPTEGPLDFARRAGTALPDSAVPIMEVTRCYVSVVYGRRSPRDVDYARLRRLIQSV